MSCCLLSGCCWGLVTKDCVEYDVGRHSCSVVELVVVVCFFVDVVFLCGVEHSPFLVVCKMDMVCSSVPGGGSVPRGVFLIVISCSSGCSPVYVLCNVYRRSVQSGLSTASGSGCRLARIFRFLSIYLIVGGGAQVIASVQFCDRC
jgi:hypothetical protein